MLHARLALSALGTIAMTVPYPGNAQETSSFDRAVAAVQDRMAPIDAQADRFPGRVLVFSKVGEPPIVDARGVADIETGRPVNADTPFYIASMTKAFVGLMAVRLDAMGVMPLETTLAEAYPGMRVEGVNLSQVTMRDALSHRMGFTSPALSLRTAYTDRAPVADYAAIVSASHETTDPGFSYTNAGYILYAGALERRTGRSWKSWLDQLVLMPLGMHHSSARTTDLPHTSNTHEIYESGWRTYRPKTDAIMHAAGGMVVSGADMAAWLAANAGGDSAIGRETFELAHGKLAESSREAGPVSCTGYAFGWAVCEAGGIAFLEHGGTYTGARSEMIVLPDHGVGFAAMFNSDSMTGGLGMQLFTTFVMAYAGEEASLPPPDAFAARYAEIADRYRINRSREEANGGEADWTPSGEQLAAYGGSYTHPGFGLLGLAAREGELVGDLNGTALVIAPVSADGFAVRLATDNEVQPFRFVRDASGRIVSVDWGGDVFDRQ